MLTTRVAAGIRAGIVALAVTTGAIIGLGLRHGLAAQSFEVGGRALLGVAASAPAAAAAGFLAHAAWMLVLGVCFSVVAAPLRGLWLFIAALVFAAIAWTLSVWLFPGVVTVMRGAAVSTPQVIFVNLLLAAGLAAGMRLALEWSRKH